MRKDAGFILALSILALFRSGQAADVAGAAQAPGDPYYCPPGAAFCPAPGSAPGNTIALDTHFGMDAQTGEVKAYRGATHPTEMAAAPAPQESVLYVAPPISVDSRYVPPQNAGGTNAPGAPARTNATKEYAPRPAPRQAPAAGATSEVAYKQATRPNPKVANDDNKVPWYKGGWWRNRRDDKPNPQPTAKNDASASTAQKQRQTQTSNQTATRQAPGGEDIWGEEEYTGYNMDGSFDRNAPSSGGYSGGYSGGATVAADSAAVYSAAPGGQPVGGFIGDAYTLPDSPPPTSPYQPGYVYPGTALSYESTGQGGGYSGQGQPYSSQPYPAPQPYASQPYAAPQPVSAPVYQAQPQTQSTFVDSGFMPPPPGGAPASAAAANAPRFEPGADSPQFTNAVRLVKDNRFGEAKTILLDETGRNPGNAAAWRWLGDCHYNLLELDAAITSYQRALERDPNDYYALRGQAFANLHRGHEHWRRMQEEAARGQKDQAAATFAQAHENYKKSLELIGLCLRRAPNDAEAVYGEAMAAEGASRKLYSNAISYLKLGPENRERAELFAENCLTVINKGIERSRERARQNPGESGPRALLGGLYLRKAILYRHLGKNDLALVELKNARDVQQSILDEIDKNNATAQKSVRECETYWDEWGGGRRDGRDA